MTRAAQDGPSRPHPASSPPAIRLAPRPAARAGSRPDARRAPPPAAPDAARPPAFQEEAMLTARRLNRGAIVPRLLTGLCLLLAPAVPAGAQQQLGAIQGTIADQSGGVIPGVTVTVTNLGTGIARTTVTNEVGIYRVPSLDPGRYEVVAELMGFRKAIRTGVILSVGTTLGVNFTLEPGEVTETIEVTGVAPDIQTEKADLSAIVERKKVVDLPLVSRNPLALAALQPGVVGIPSTSHLFVTEQGLGINANGQRESGNNAMVDGITISGGPWGGSMLVVPNVEAVEEFQIIVNNPSAEFGRNAGAAVSIVTRGGTNDLSGSVFEFHRDDGLREKNIFETTKPPFDRDEFGVTVGGPIRRDRTFFFFSYDGLRQKGGGAALRTVETEQLKNWVLANRPNSIAAQLLSKYPPPIYPTTGLRDLGGPLPGANNWSTAPDGIPDVGTISLAVPSRNIGDQFNGRVDQVLRHGSDRIRASYYANTINNPAVYIRPQFDHDFTFLNQLLASNWSRVISNRTLNELSFGWVRQHGETGDPTPEVPTIGITGLSYGFGVDFWHPITFTQNNFEIRNVLTMTRGTHSFRIGGELRHGRDGAILHHWERPNYTFASILDFIDDEPFSETRAVDPVTGRSTVAPGTYITNEWGLFVQDNWKVRPNLTLNLGLRYDNFGNPGKKEGRFNAIVLGPGSTRQEQVARAKVAALDRIYETDWNNVAPRLGVAWDPKGDASFVVRAGAGVSYNRINNTAYSDERLNPPLFASASTNIFDPSVAILYTTGPAYPANPALGRGLDENGGIRGSRVNLRVIDPAITIPYVYSWFAGAQYQLPWDFVLDVNYVGSASRNLLGADGPTSNDYNRFAGDLLDGVFNRLNPSFGTVHITESRIDASYHGLATQVSRRYKQGFSFQVAYTLGRARDARGNMEEVTDPAREKGPADYDVRHVVKLNAIWEIPFRSGVKALEYVLGGWQVNAITVYQSGNPFSVVCTLAYPRCDFNADGQTGDRVNVTRTDLGSPSRDEWLAGVLSAADYSLPAIGTLATQQRNAFRGPSYFNTDLSFFKNIPVPWYGTRDARLQIRVEAFNLFNRAHLGNPVAVTNDALFGRVTGLRGGTNPRTFQLGAKFSF
jgi:hypothetical protein